MNSENSTPRLKLIGKHLVGFDTDRGTVAKVGALKLGASKPGILKPKPRG
jgi:hypothetical protein